MMKALLYGFICTSTLLLNGFCLTAQDVDTTFYDNGRISSIGSYDSKGRQKGYWIYYLENGFKEREGEYIKGKYHGKWLSYAKDGDPSEIGIYKKNKLIASTLPDGSPVTFTRIETMPDFPGGADSMMTYLANSITYPTDAKDGGVEGEVIASFVVGMDGWVQEVTIIKAVHPSIDEEVIRVINAMPRWTPGMQDGKPVKVQYNLPINFSLPKK